MKSIFFREIILVLTAGFFCLADFVPAYTAENTDSAAKEQTARKKKKSSKGRKKKKAALYAESGKKIQLIRQIIAENPGKPDDPEREKKIYDKVAEKMPLTPKEKLQSTNYKQIKEAANAAAKKILERNSTAFRYKVQSEAEAEFPMEKEHTNVSFTYKQGPFNRKIKGFYHGSTKSNIQVDDTTISFIDMPDHVRSRFDPDYNQRSREKYVMQKMKQYFAGTDQKAEELAKKKQADIIRNNEKNGYIFETSTEKWTTAKELTGKLIHEVK